MAIHDIKVGEGVIPNLPTAVGFNVDPLAFGSMDSAIKSQITRLDKSVKNAEDSIDMFSQATDKLTNFRVDNHVQQQVLDETKKSSGIENVFSTATLESLKSPYGAKIVESAYNKFVSDPKIANVIMEQTYADKYQKDLTKINDPVLRQMAIEDYQSYRMGEKTGDQLVADDYQELDLPKIIGTDFKAIVPKVEENMKRNNTFQANYIESLKTRDADTMRLVFENRLTDPKFVNNLVAKGLYDKAQGKLTPEGESYIKNLTDQYTIEDAKKKNIRWDKQVNEYKSNITKTSTYTGTQTINVSGGTSKTVTINKNGEVSIPKFEGNNKAAKAANTWQDMLGKDYGINLQAQPSYFTNIDKSIDDNGDPVTPKAMEGFLIKKALKDERQSAFSIMAFGHDVTKTAQEILADYEDDKAHKIGYGRYLTKKGGKDKKLLGIFEKMDAVDKSKFLLRAVDEAKEFLANNNVTPTKLSTKNSTTSPAPKYKAKLKKNNNKDSGY